MTAPVPAPRPVSVTGGAGGISADLTAMRAMAGRFGGAASDTLGSALSLHRYLLDPAVAGSALLDPGGFAAFEGELTWALDGFQGLSWAGTEAGLVDGELRLAADTYEQADHIYTDAHDFVLGALGFFPALGAGLRVLAGTHDPIRAAEAVVADDPELADVLVDTLGVPGILSALAGKVPDGHGVVRHPGVDTSGPAGRAPRSLTDVLADLAQRDGDAHHGEIDVRILTLPDGSRRAIIDVTGTKSWDPFPTHDVTSLTTNGRALVGDRTAYETGVLAAMRQAGVRRSDAVMIVGHSEGGMVAVTTARDAVRSGEFNVTHVITAGAPIGLTVGQLPAKVQVLALENSRDVVPHLDGAANPDRANVTTVSGSRGDETITGDHGVRSAYVPLAGDAQASNNRSIRDFLHSAKGYLQAIKVETHTYQVQRAY